jgi:putative flippase GtrA
MRLPPFAENLCRRMLPTWVDRALIIKAVCFAMIGCVNATVDFTVFSIGYFLTGLPIVIANVISWSVAVTNSYALNSMITFAAESGRRLNFKAYGMFAATQLGGLIANTLTVVLASYFIPVMLAKLLAIGASFVVDFTLSHLVVFRRREQPTR